jgi:hypothetical protein
MRLWSSEGQASIIEHAHIAPRYESSLFVGDGAYLDVQHSTPGNGGVTAEADPFARTKIHLVLSPKKASLVVVIISLFR